MARALSETSQMNEGAPGTVEYFIWDYVNCVIEPLRSSKRFMTCPISNHLPGASLNSEHQSCRELSNNLSGMRRRNATLLPHHRSAEFWTRLLPSLRAVAAAARLLAAEGCPGMLTVPGDIPLVTTAEITQLLAAHRPAPAFTIAPSRDERGSNAIICSPPDAVPLRFGEDSFFPHLRAAEE